MQFRGNPDRNANNPVFNSFNLEERIELLNKDGEVLFLICAQEANRLLKRDEVILLLRYPVAVQMKNDKLNTYYFEGRKKHTTSKIYGNYTILNKAGEKMFCCNDGKALWYLNRDLVDIVSEVPPVLQLRFEPKGKGHAGDQFFLGNRENCCVVCGTRQHLSRHHVVPFCFRKHLPEHLKSHSYYDILPLCRECHNQYEREADYLKWELCVKYKVKMSPTTIYNRDFGNAISSAAALMKHGDKIPLERRKELEDKIKIYLQVEDLSEDQIAALSKTHRRETVTVIDDFPFGDVILNQVDFQEFSEMWRKHFVEKMCPQYMPEHWTVDKPAFREEDILRGKNGISL